MPVYQGRNSCYARKEGIYVRRIARPGVDTVAEAVALAHMCVRDYRRGWTYEQGTCRKIKMSLTLFKKRVRFILRLAKLHGASKHEINVIEKLVKYVLKYKKLPSTVDGKSTKSLVKKMIVKR